MAQLTTGIIENTPVFGLRPTVLVTVRITNDDIVAANVEIIGYFVAGAVKIPYVLELFDILPGEVETRNYFADLDGLEYQFVTSSDSVVISVWGKDAIGNLVAAQRVVTAELNPF